MVLVSFTQGKLISFAEALAGKLGYLAVRNSLYKFIYDMKKPVKPTNDLSHREKGVIAGFSGGVATAVVHPLETIMVRKIGELGRPAKFHRADMYSRLYNGVWANVVRMALFNGIMIWPYDVMKEKLYVTFGDIWPNRIVALAVASFVGLGTTLLFDVIKTRQMFAYSDPHLNRLNYKNAVDLVTKAMVNEGPFTFFAGCWPMYAKIYVYALCVR